MPAPGCDALSQGGDHSLGVQGVAKEDWMRSDDIKTQIRDERRFPLGSSIICAKVKVELTRIGLKPLARAASRSKCSGYELCVIAENSRCLSR